LFGRFAPEVRNLRIVQGVSGGHSGRHHQRDVASHAIELTIGADGRCNFLVSDSLD
jgi:hypothetical protein